MLFNLLGPMTTFLGPIRRSISLAIIFVVIILLRLLALIIR